MLTNKKSIYLGATIFSAMILTVLSGQTVKADTTNPVNQSATVTNVSKNETTSSTTNSQLATATNQKTSKENEPVTNNQSATTINNDSSNTATAPVTNTDDNTDANTNPTTTSTNNNEPNPSITDNSNSSDSTSMASTSNTDTSTQTDSSENPIRVTYPTTPLYSYTVENTPPSNETYIYNGLAQDGQPNIAMPSTTIVSQTNITNDTQSYALPNNLTDDTVVNFSDSNLAALVKTSLGIKTSDNITVGDIKNYKSNSILTISGDLPNQVELPQAIESLDGMQYLNLLPSSDAVDLSVTLASDEKANPSLVPLDGLKFSSLTLDGNYSDPSRKEINVSQIPDLTILPSYMNDSTLNLDITNKFSFNGDEAFNGFTNDDVKEIAPWLTKYADLGMTGDVYFYNSTVSDFSSLKNMKLFQGLFNNGYLIAWTNSWNYNPKTIYGVIDQPLIFKADPFYDNSGNLFDNPKNVYRNNGTLYNFTVNDKNDTTNLKYLGNEYYEIQHPDGDSKMLVYGNSSLGSIEPKEGNPFFGNVMHDQPIIWQDHPNVTIEYVDQNGNPIMSNGVPLTKTVNGNLIGDSFDLTKEASLNGYTLLSPTTSLQGKYEQAPQVIKLSYKENPVPVSASNDEVNPTTVNTLATPITIIPKVIGTVSLHDLTGAETGKDLVVNGSEITISATAMINGQEYYQIGNKWVCADDFDIVETDKLGYVRIYNEVASLINSDGQLLSRELGPNTGWKFNRIVSIDGNDFYQVATNEFVSVDSGVPYIPINDKTDVNLTKPAELYDSQGPDLDKSLPTKTSWRTDSYAKINGIKMYRVATDEWIPADTLNVVQTK
ncbi:MucBP domain-containing protein [Companilactobacillus pabuli]|uniref:MucBP domain-containing protein n=1 Tax=Companilactobacillus pabuli TaxID=2714036 RepID=UPI00241678D1|nr:MucBP domain-containing protein [Companilactobacillus pabuli]MDG5113848.1 SLAP domain-containing protein [Companilactobacillus pabuli]